MSDSSSPLHPRKHKRIAVVGGGISGISCLWTLKDHPNYEVHVFEAEDRLGGHAHTVAYTNNGVTVNVDTGFIAMNEETYPKFTKFLRQLNVPTIPTDMSFGVSVNRGFLEWGSGSLAAFIGSWPKLIRPWFWRLCFDIVRFNLTCLSALIPPTTQAHPHHPQNQSYDETLQGLPMESIGHYLERLNYSKQFAAVYLIPMVAAPWCINPTEFSRNFPAKFLIEFMANHRLLDTLWHTLRWRTFPDGSNSYVEAFTKTLPTNHHLHLETKVISLRRQKDGSVNIFTEGGGVAAFDHVILAVHAPQALKIIGDYTSNMEKKLLGAFKTSRNVCVLHADESLLPRRANARSSWNCLLEQPIHGSNENKRPIAPSSGTDNTISITFDMSRLQSFHLANDTGRLGRVLVTMNPPRPVSSPKLVCEYFHPLFSSESVKAARQLRRINGVDGVSFAGAWMGYGFHEDGFVAGESVAHDLLRRDGVVINDEDHQISVPVGRALCRNRFVVSLIQIIQFFIDVFTLIWGDPR